MQLLLFDNCLKSIHHKYKYFVNKMQEVRNIFLISKMTSIQFETGINEALYQKLISSPIII